MILFCSGYSYNRLKRSKSKKIFLRNSGGADGAAASLLSFLRETINADRYWASHLQRDHHRRLVNPYLLSFTLIGPSHSRLCNFLCRHQGHSTAGSITSIEKSNDLIGNQTRDLPDCSTVPQPTTLPRAPS
jgi:hypothetical protein